MAADVGDCATVLEQFIHDSANLPAEINYMMEEIQAIDKDLQKYHSNIRSKESALEKQIKNHGSMQAHPKEHEYAEFTKKHYDICIDLQKKKILHSDRACSMLDRQLKRLDERIRQLQKHGQMDDEPPLPSVFNRRPESQKPLIDISAGPVPLQVANANALNMGAHRSNSNVVPTIRPPQPRQVTQITASTVPPLRNSTPSTPASTSTQATKHQQEREHSAGPDSKRRKLTTSLTGINLPAQPSNLRQSSLGPGTPKAGTPTGSRAGSIPRQTGSIGVVPKKVGAINKKVPNHQVTKLKNKHKQHVRLSQSGGRKKGASPSVRGARGGTAASEESVLSSTEASETDASQTRGRRKKATQQPDPQSGEEEEDGDEPDDKIYCYCSQPSYGEMVGCENPTCKHEWFHISCLGLKSPPTEDRWYCPECRTEQAAAVNKQKRK